MAKTLTGEKGGFPTLAGSMQVNGSCGLSIKIPKKGDQLLYLLIMSQSNTDLLLAISYL